MLHQHHPDRLHSRVYHTFIRTDDSTQCDVTVFKGDRVVCYNRLIITERDLLKTAVSGHTGATTHQKAKKAATRKQIRAKNANKPKSLFGNMKPRDRKLGKGRKAAKDGSIGGGT